MTNIKTKNYKLTSVEVEEKLLEQVKAKLKYERKTFTELVEKAMKRYLRKVI